MEATLFLHGKKSGVSIAVTQDTFVFQNSPYIAVSLNHTISNADYEVAQEQLRAYLDIEQARDLYAQLEKALGEHDAKQDEAEQLEVLENADNVTVE